MIRLRPLRAPTHALARAAGRVSRAGAFTRLAFAVTAGVLSMSAYSTATAAGPDPAAQSGPVAIALHAGAGTISRDRLDPETEERIRATLRAAALAGHEVLKSGGSGIDAVLTAVTLLEDSPDFNAGRGAVFNAQGRHEMDASIMNGADLSAGAVAGVRLVRNPITLAHRVLTDSPHVMLTGDGAEAFARQQGIAFEDEAYFHTDYRWQQLQDARASDDPEAHAVSESPDRWLSTVGAVALDAAGNLAAATSTGGTTNKRWGRVGDSPIIGAGTYADNRSCAVSATGHGEYFIRATVAADICARVRYQGVGLEQAADSVINGQLVDMGGDGGVIAIDPDGNIALVFNTAGMYRASIDTTGRTFIGIYREETP
ncbi:isoaspartyl peptidase/L-asparaginase family protein [Elongatibacter sediminis]|uniref:Isoaspartyl peptidase n=1 Tax=Elongatibacter sediminis TaxID=3119006 RepID=A0AAW9RCJ7_9GAMM